MSTIYVVLNEKSEQAIASLLWSGAAVEFGRKAAEMIGVPFNV